MIPARGAWLAVFLLTTAWLLALPMFWPAKLAAGVVAAVIAMIVLASAVLPRTAEWSFPVGGGLAVAAATLLVQGALVLAYVGLTMAGHEAPWMSGLVAALVRLLGISAGSDAGTIHVPAMRGVQSFAVTWEALGLLPGLLFAGGGIAMLRLLGARGGAFRRAVLGSVMVTAAYLPLRLAFLIVLHHALTPYLAHETDYNFIRMFLDPWVTVLSFAPLAALHEALRPAPVAAAAPDPGRAPARAARDGEPPRTRNRGWAIPAGVAGIGLIVLGFTVEIPGRAASVRLLIDNGHSEWERVDRPLDTDWYGTESGYNYYSAVDYLSRFFTVDSTRAPLTPEVLASCDVLMLRLPTNPFAPTEIEAILDFVRRGGGVFLIGDHTNVFGSSEFLNAIARPLGFAYRYDCLFDVERTFHMVYRPPRLLAHPVTAGLPPLLLMTPCSLRLLRGGLEMVMVQPRAKGLAIDYSSINFYPAVVDHPGMEWGAFPLMVARKLGRGRVAGFTDSTIFSNFALFFPGRAELLVRTVAWLARPNRATWLNPVLILIGLAALGLAVGPGGVRHARGPRLAFCVLMMALGAELAAVLASGANARVLADLEPRRDLPVVAFPVGHSDDPFSLLGVERGRPHEYKVFFQWILRVGAFPAVRDDVLEAADGARLMVLIQPNRAFGDGEVAAVRDFVARGGALLVLDGPRNRPSTSNQVLRPFGLSFSNSRAVTYSALLDPGGEALVSQGPFGGWRVSGGEAILQARGSTLAAAVRHGEGVVIAAGIATQFADAFMGDVWSAIPTEAQRRLYQLEFDLVRDLLQGRVPRLDPARFAGLQVKR